MASNPMQKKSRNSFLLGMLLTLVIAAIAMGAMFVMLNKSNKEQEKKEASQTKVYRLTTPVKSGEEVDYSKIAEVVVNSEAVPGDAFGSQTGFPSGYKAKIDLQAGTIISENMLYEGDKIQDSLRRQEYNIIQLPEQLSKGDYIDIRYMLPTGQDYIVVAKKEILDTSVDTIWVELTEDEIMLMSNAIVEAYTAPSSKLYATVYVEPGTQIAATSTYIPSDDVIAAIEDDPNIVQTAKNALFTRFNQNKRNRDYINSVITQYQQEALDNIEASLQESREKAREQREMFLNGVR